MTFQKERTVLGIAGNFIPSPWLIGAVLTAKIGSGSKLCQQLTSRKQSERLAQ
jgi:hypothetical protein